MFLSQTEQSDSPNPKVRQFHQQGCGELHRAKGRIHYKHGLQQPNPYQYLQNADESYQEALRFLTVQEFPEPRLEVIKELIEVFLAFGKIEEAKHLQREGLDLLSRLLSKPNGFRQQKHLALKFAGFDQLTVDIWVRTGQLLKAWQTAEKGKNVCLKWLLSEQELLVPTYQKAQQLLNDSTAAIYWHLSPSALTTFILRSKTLVPVLIHSETSVNPGKIPESLQRLLEFENWLTNWDQQYAAYRNKGKEPSRNKQNDVWRTFMLDNFERIKNILDISTIEAELVDVTHLILIPHRDLHRLPLHALFDERFTITYLPSVQIGLNLQRCPHIEQSHTLPLINVDNPTNDLPPLKFASVESGVIRHLWGNATAIAQTGATQSAVLNALKQPYKLFHFTGHGGYETMSPENSALALAGTDRLTAKQISQILPSQQYHLVSLAACETALTGNQKIETEYVGLVSAFLQAKTTYVVSTLWEVEDDANAWMMINFYQRLKQGAEPAQALKQTQDWFSTVTSITLAKWLQDLSQLEGLTLRNRDYLRTRAARMSTMDSFEPVYSDPYYWAAFILTGKVPL